MWVVTKSDWPVLINLNRAAHVGYQQIAKYDPRTRVIASMWEQEFVVADCASGDDAKAVIGLIARALADGADVLDLRGIDLAEIGRAATAKQPSVGGNSA
jgi:hypothetical protein